METANSVIADILQEISVHASGQPIEAVDFQFVLRYMNRYMAQLSITTPLGYTKVTKTTDPITIADGAFEGLIFNVALRVLNSFSIEVGPTLVTTPPNGATGGLVGFTSTQIATHASPAF